VGLMWLCMCITGVLGIIAGLMWMTEHNYMNRPVRFVQPPIGTYEQGYKAGLQAGLENISAECWYQNNKNPDISGHEFGNYIKVTLPSKNHKEGWTVWYPRPER